MVKSLLSRILSHSILLTLCMMVIAHAETDQEPKLVASSNLLGLITLNPNLEIDVSVYGPLSIGGSIWWEVREVEDRWAQGRVTYYPLGLNYERLGLSITGGWHKAWRERDAVNQALPSASSATMGGLISWDFVFKSIRPLRIALLSGAKWTLSNNDDNSPLKPSYIELRLLAGWKI